MLYVTSFEGEDVQKKLGQTTEETLQKAKRSYAKLCNNGTRLKFKSICCNMMSSGYSTHLLLLTTEEHGKDVSEL